MGKQKRQQSRVPRRQLPRRHSNNKYQRDDRIENNKINFKSYHYAVKSINSKLNKITLSKSIPRPTKPPITNNNTLPQSDEDDDDLKIIDIDESILHPTPGGPVHIDPLITNFAKQRKRKRNKSNHIKNSADNTSPVNEPLTHNDSIVTTNHPPIKKRKVDNPPSSIINHSPPTVAFTNNVITLQPHSIRGDPPPTPTVSCTTVRPPDLPRPIPIPIPSAPVAAAASNAPPPAIQNLIPPRPNDTFSDTNRCDNCHNTFPRKTGIDKTGMIHKYRIKWICGECAGKDKSDKQEMDVIKMWTEYKCIHPDCNENKQHKIWSGPNAHRNWVNHYFKHHPTDEFLNITNKKLCIAPHCTSVIPKSSIYQHCIDHRTVILPTDPPSSSPTTAIPSNNNNHNHNSHNNQTNVPLSASPPYAEDPNDVIIDGGGRPYNINRTLKWYDVDEKWKNEDQREDAAKIIVAALYKMSQTHINTNRGIEGALELRFFGPTFHFIPYHDKQPYQYKQELIRRRRLFQDKKWDELQRRIDYEQDRRNQKKQRKYDRDNQHINPSLSAIPAPSTSNTDQNDNNHNNSNHSNQHIPDPHNQLQSNPLQSNEKEIGIYLNDLIQNIDDYKYDEYDTAKDVQYRIKRCIKLAKQNKFKKADAALNQPKLQI